MKKIILISLFFAPFISKGQCIIYKDSLVQQGTAINIDSAHYTLPVSFFIKIQGDTHGFVQSANIFVKNIPLHGCDGICIQKMINDSAISWTNKNYPSH